MPTATPNDEKFPTNDTEQPTPPRDPGKGLPNPDKVGKAQFFVDVAERAVATYLEALVGLLVVAQKIDLDLLTASAVAAVPAGLAVIKAGLGRFLGDKKSAGFLPKRWLKRA